MNSCENFTFKTLRLVYFGVCGPNREVPHIKEDSWTLRSLWYSVSAKKVEAVTFRIRTLLHGQHKSVKIRQ